MEEIERRERGLEEVGATCHIPVLLGWQLGKHATLTVEYYLSK